MTTDPAASPPWVIDTHVHLDILHRRLGDKVQWFQEHACTPISWAFDMNIDTISDLKSYFSRQARVISKLHGQNPWGCFFLVGIHPRNLTADLVPERVAEILMPFLSHPLCLGLGEIGLETGTQQEKEIFQAQLELARSLINTGIRLGVHTPRAEKAAETMQILAILDDFKDLYPVTVVDHCNAETLADVLDQGLWAGVTLSPFKTAVEQLPDLVTGHHQALSRLMCNTDSMEALYPDLINASYSQLLPGMVKQQITQRAAAHFWDLKIDTSRIVVRGHGNYI